jgi:hypothetical protein
VEEIDTVGRRVHFRHYVRGRVVHPLRLS